MAEAKDVEAREVKVGDHVANLGGVVTKISERGGMLVLEAGSIDNSMMLFPGALVRIVDPLWSRRGHQ